MKLKPVLPVRPRPPKKPREARNDLLNANNMAEIKQALRALLV